MAWRSWLRGKLSDQRQHTSGIPYLGFQSLSTRIKREAPIRLSFTEELARLHEVRNNDARRHPQPSWTTRIQLNTSGQSILMTISLYNTSHRCSCEDLLKLSTYSCRRCAGVCLIGNQFKLYDVWVKPVPTHLAGREDTSFSYRTVR
jgi:hypothetical protein